MFESEKPITAINSFIRARPKGLLHHYTTSAGLIGIFESRKIWASSIKHLNDSEEYSHAIKLLTAELEIRLNEETGPKRVLFEELLKEIETDKETRSFITSFSERSDLLSQWRAYSTCDNAYSIAFDNKELTGILKASRCVLVKCEYRIEFQKKLLNQLADYLYKMRVRCETLNEAKSWGWMGRTAPAIEGVLAAIKHPSFEEEQEWRIVTPKDSRIEMCFRTGRFGIVPFYKLPLKTDEKGKLFFSELIIGPTQNRAAAEFAANELVERHGVRWKIRYESLVHHSNTSLRP